MQNQISQPRDVQVATIGPDTIVFRSRTWDRLKFEVEYARQRGTTANSYLIKGDRIALIDPPGESFTMIYLQELARQVSLADIHEVILGHVNPNRLMTLRALLQQSPHIRFVCSRPAAITLKAAFPDQQQQILTVRGGEVLDLGQGHQLQFISAPTPRWPDGLFTWDSATRILYTDKFLGVHVCDDLLYDENWKQLSDDRRYYFDCLHAAQARQAEMALEKLRDFPAKLLAPGHGPIVRYSVGRFLLDYRDWCQQQKTQESSVVILYASAYGNTATIGQAITHGLLTAGASVEMINCEFADPTTMIQALEKCEGFIIGSPTLAGHAPTQIQTALGIILANTAKTKLVGVFGSYGWSGEAIDMLEGKLRDAGYLFGFETIRAKFKPTEALLEQCQAAGSEFVQVLKKTRKLRAPRAFVPESQSDRTKQALGRLMGSLSVITTQKEGLPAGLLTSWVSQATFNPPGLTVALAKSYGNETLIAAGEPFVLNLLKEGRNVRKNFQAACAPGEDPFAGLASHPAGNGCLVLDDALAYLECRVQSRMECGDHWLIYATVDCGKVLEHQGMTAVEPQGAMRKHLLRLTGREKGDEPTNGASLE